MSPLIQAGMTAASIRLIRKRTTGRFQWVMEVFCDHLIALPEMAGQLLSPLMIIEI